MNKLNYIRLRFLLLTGFILLLSSCDLELQEGYSFSPDVDLTDPYANLTAWEFINTQTALNDEGNLDGEAFNYLIEAIKRAGFEDEYNNNNIIDRTYLLLNNNAFTGGGDIIELVTGSEEVGEDETPAEIMARADVDVLRLILQYHIVTTYVDQIPTLFEYDEWYLFQTLISGEDGIIGLLRDNRYRISINGTRNDRVPSPLPSSAFSQFEEVRLHNYVFSNGIGHVIADPVRNAPYPDPQVEEEEED